MSLTSSAVKGVLGALSGKSPVARSAIQYAAYSGAASFVDRYAEGNYESTGAQLAAGILSTGLRLKSYQTGLMGLSRAAGRATQLAGEGFYRMAAPRQHIGHKKISFQLFGKRVEGRVPMRKLTPASVPPDHISRRVRRATIRMAKPFLEKGAVDEFLSGLGPVSLAKKAVPWIGKGAVGAASFPVSAAIGVGEYASTFARAARRKTYTDGWTTLALGMGSMKHPWAPMFLGGAAIGAAAPIARNSMGIQSGPVPVEGGTGPMNTYKYGGGISFGRPSPVKSRTVRDGQRAVTASMLNNRRI